MFPRKYSHLGDESPPSGVLTARLSQDATWRLPTHPCPTAEKLGLATWAEVTGVGQMPHLVTESPGARSAGRRNLTSYLSTS